MWEFIKPVMVRSKIVGVLALACLLTVSQAQAAPITGSEALPALGGITANTPDVDTATVFTFAAFGIGSKTGDYVGDITVTIPGPFTLTVSPPGSPNSFTISSPGWGTFTAMTLQLDDPTPPTFRQISFDGMFTPGPNFGAFAGMTNTASLDISFTQAGGPGNAISASATSSLALAGIGCVVGLGYVIRRRRMTA